MIKKSLKVPNSTTGLKTSDHHIHVKLGDEIHTIACKGNFIDFADLCKVIDEINSNYQHKVIHNANDETSCA